jgi:sulfur transfer complex TusBCD TusB component (DsrH family)
MKLDVMRKAVADAYNGPLWRLKVQEMPDRQVIAIYKDLCARGAFEPKPKIKPKLHEEKECIQLTIWDFMR